jgi:hypothetical protein
MSLPDTAGPPKRRRGARTMELVMVLAVFVAWAILQVWILPGMGAKT